VGYGTPVEFWLGYTVDASVGSALELYSEAVSDG
jgi:hypothetical protein